MNNVKLSIIMPVYNAEAFLEESVRSILAQSCRDWELILINDGSTDDSFKLCEHFATIDSRIRFFSQKNSGISVSRNNGIRWAKGDYVAFCDHDDTYEKDLVATVLKKIELTNADIVKYGKNVIRKVGNVEQSFNTYSFSDEIYFKNDIIPAFFKMLNTRKLDCVWDAFFRREFLTKNKIMFDTAFKCGGEDIDFIQRCLLCAKIFVTMKGVFYNHYLRVGVSTSSKFDERKIFSAEYQLRKFTEELRVKEFDIKQYDVEYIKFAVFYCFNGTAALLSHPKCSYTLSKKVECLKSLKKLKCLPVWFFERTFSLKKEMDMKYFLSYLLFKYGFYRTLLLINDLRLRYISFRD